ASYIACGVFASSLTSQSVVAFLISLVFLLLNNFFGQEFFLSRLPLFLKNIFSYLSLSWHANQFSWGIVSLIDVVFFLSWTIIFLILTILSLKSRNK
ncbi:ABC transporter permease, partial [Patescibacteria group bacterium]|nr:ABC transporter permease [Patescibacteria group bacterium]